MNRNATRTAALFATAALLFAGCSSAAKTGANASLQTTTTVATTKTSTTKTSTTNVETTNGSTTVKTSVTAPTPTPRAGSKAAASVEPLGTYPVGTTQVDLVDKTRGTPANAGAPATDVRNLPTVVFYPAATGSSITANGKRAPAVQGAKAADGRFPLIVFSHGVTGRGIFYRGELEAWASAGYVVIAPDYPLSNFDSPGGPTINDVGNQPGDASFLIDAFVDEAGDSPAAKVAKEVDADHIGAVGHSLGAITSLGLGYLPCCAENRVDAVASWAGVFLPMKGQATPDPSITGRPLLLVHGDKDPTVPYKASVSAFAKVASPRWFITLPGEGHVEPFLSPGTSSVSALVTQATLDFFDAQLKGDPTGISRLRAAVTAAGRDTATLESAGS